MATVSARVRARAVQDFGTGAPEVIRQLETLELGDVEASERVQAAILLFARGRVQMVDDCVALATVDWRDVLVRGELADEDWRERVDLELGSVDRADTISR